MQIILFALDLSNNYYYEGYQMNASDRPLHLDNAGGK